MKAIFLGIDHNFRFDENRGGPILFETMVFRKLATPKRSPFGDGAHEFTHDATEQWRWRTENEARRAHGFIVGRLREAPDADLSDYDPLSPS